MGKVGRLRCLLRSIVKLQTLRPGRIAIKLPPERNKPVNFLACYPQFSYLYSMDILTLEQRNILWKAFFAQKLTKQKEICATHGFSESNFSRHMNGKPLALDTLLKYLKAAGILPPSKFILPEQNWKTFKQINGIQAMLF